MFNLPLPILQHLNYLNAPSMLANALRLAPFAKLAYHGMIIERL